MCSLLIATFLVNKKHPFFFQRWQSQHSIIRWMIQLFHSSCCLKNNVSFFLKWNRMFCHPILNFRILFSWSRVFSFWTEFPQIPTSPFPNGLHSSHASLDLPSFSGSQVGCEFPAGRKKKTFLWQIAHMQNKLITDSHLICMSWG